MDSAQLDALERLAKNATPGPWSCEWFTIFKRNLFFHQHILTAERVADVDYIVSACNAMPELIAENRALQERVQELEKALIELVKIEVSLPECAVCWERDRCTDRSHGDNCLAVGYIVDMAKEAAKEAGK